jgi:aldehyde dehydrogenase (NAD+)
MSESLYPEKEIAAQRPFFDKRKPMDTVYRKLALKRLYDTILCHEQEIYRALDADFGKSPFETWSTEIGLVLEEIRNMIRNLTKWSRPDSVKTPIIHFPSVSRIHKEPFGQVLIMAPWNYPFMLAMMPFVGAIAAGNCVVLKTAHYSTSTSLILEQIIRESFVPEHALALGGGREINTRLLDTRFDYIFFTGSPSLGKLVMEKASANLTPVTLELGGKSPCIVSSKCNPKLAARRIIWGKLINAGQTCVAPDYLLVESSIKDQLIKEMILAIKESYGSDPSLSTDFPRIINTPQWERLNKLVSNEKVLCGGQSNRETRYFAPTLIDEPDPDSPVMMDEIFGPILPVISWENKRAAVKYVLEHPKPLACYIFTNDPTEEKFFLENIPFGGGCINDTIIHIANPYLPFGGVGGSGMGRYHGRESFLIFSNRKAVLKKGTWLDVPVRYPPYTEKKLKAVKAFLH